MKRSQLADELDEIHAEFGYRASEDGTDDKTATAERFYKLFQPLKSTLQVRADQDLPAAVTDRLCSIAREARSRHGLIVALRRETEAVFHPLADEYISSLQASPAHEPALRSFGRSAIPLAEKMRGRVEFTGDSCDELEKVIQFARQVLKYGVTNIAHRAWVFQEAIPHVYQQESRCLSAADYDTTGESTYELIEHLASCHDDVFTAFVHYLEAAETGDEPDKWPPFETALLKLSGSKLECCAEVFAGVRILLGMMLKDGKLHLDQPRVGCASPFLFRPVFDYCRKSAQQCLYPNAGRIVSLPVSETLKVREYE